MARSSARRSVSAHGPYPTLVYVYGGPHAQLVADGWMLTVAMRAQYLRSLGFLVFVLDNRGSARRGLAFEGAIKHDMGHAEVDDQVDGVRWLVAQGLADPAAGGRLRLELRRLYGGDVPGARPGDFQRRPSPARRSPHWDGYDTHYTERYMGTPAIQPAGLPVSSVMQHVDRYAGQADAGAWSDRRECALPPYRPPDQRPDHSPQAV